jgi:hypothetical protein
MRHALSETMTSTPAVTTAPIVFDHILKSISEIGEYIRNNPKETLLIYIFTALVALWLARYLHGRVHRHCLSKEEHERFLRQWSEHGDLGKLAEGMKAGRPHTDEMV